MTPKTPPRPVATLAIWAGYRITDASLRGETPRHRVVAPITSRGRKTADVSPDAFRDFVDGCSTEADVERLANRYGFLGTEQDYDVVLGEDNEFRSDIAEPVSTWLTQAQALREVWGDWIALQDPKADVSSRAFALLAYDEFLPETSMGLPPGGLGEAQAPCSDLGPFPTRLEVGDDLRIVADEYEAAARALYAAEEAFKKAADAKAVAKARAKLDRLERMPLFKQPDNYVGLMAAAEKTYERLRATRRESAVMRRRSNAEVRQLGLTLLGLRVTKQLRLHGVVPTLVKSPLKTLTTVRQSRRPSMALEHYAPTLLALLWLQLADAMSQSVEYRRCDGCPNYITIHPDAHRKHKTTCSDACRQRVWRAENQQKKQKPNRRSKKSNGSAPKAPHA